MDINARLRALYTELGHLDLDIRARERRRGVLVAEAEVLNRLAAEIAAAEKGAARAATVPPAVNAEADSSPTG